MAHFAVFINRNAELGGLRRFGTGRTEFHFRSLRGAERFELGRKPDYGRCNFRGCLDLLRWRFHWSGRTRAGNAHRWRCGRQFLQRGLAREVGRRMLDRRHDERFSIGGRLSGGGERGIFRVQPAEEESAFIRIRRDQADATRRGQKGNGGRVDDLENVKAESVEGEGSEKKSGNGPFAAARPLPTKDEVVRGSGWRIHLGGVVARATEVIPCSSDKFVTSTTSA